MRLVIGSPVDQSDPPPPRQRNGNQRGRLAALDALDLEQAGGARAAARQPGGDPDALPGVDPAELERAAARRRLSAPRWSRGGACARPARPTSARSGAPSPCPATARRSGPAGGGPRPAAPSGPTSVGIDQRVEVELAHGVRGAVGDGVGRVAHAAVHTPLVPVLVGGDRLGALGDRAIIATASTGYWPTAVSWESITASVPSRIALATSVTSARVGRAEVTIESSIWVAVIDRAGPPPGAARGSASGRAAPPRRPSRRPGRRARPSRSRPRRRSPRRARPPAASRSWRSAAARVWRRTRRRPRPRRTNESATQSTPMRSPACSSSRSRLGHARAARRSRPGCSAPARETTAPPILTSASNSPSPPAPRSRAAAPRRRPGRPCSPGFDRAGEAVDRDRHAVRVADHVRPHMKRDAARRA